MYRTKATVSDNSTPTLPTRHRWRLALIPLLWAMTQVSWGLASWPIIFPSASAWGAWAIESVRLGQPVVWFSLGVNAWITSICIGCTILSTIRSFRLIHQLRR